MVTQDSATNSGPTEKLSDQIPVESNHRSLVKFANMEDKTYQTVYCRLTKLVSEAPAAIARRFSSKPSSKEAIAGTSLMIHYFQKS